MLDKRIHTCYSDSVGREVPTEEQEAGMTLRQVPSPQNSAVPKNIAKAVVDLNDVMTDISRHIVGNDHIIRITGVALTAGANMFLHGMPGISKTMLAKMLAARFKGEFHRVLYGPYLEPEAVFGGQDVDEFMKGNYVRHREGTILTANVHFGDEFLESNDAMKKAMLGIFDETPTYDERGRTEYLENLLLVITASNRLPSKEDAAIGDRLVLQVPVSKPAEREDRLEILTRHDDTQRGFLSTEPQAYISLEQIKALRLFAKTSVVVPAGIMEKLVSLDDDITEKLPGVYVSPRTLNRCLDILKSNALLAGRTEVTNKDFWILQYVVAPIPQQDAARDVILDLTAPLEKEALIIMQALGREIGEWRALAKNPDRNKKAQAKKGGQDLLNSVLNYQVELEVRSEKAVTEGYDAEAINNMVTQVKAQVGKIQETIKKLFNETTD